MSVLLEELKEFLTSANLTNYEIKAFIALLKSKTLNAREISKESGVPVGRIYDTLEELRQKGMIEIQNSRPKIFKPMPINVAFQNLITHIININQSKVTYLFEKARMLEARIYKSDIYFRTEPVKTFWSTEFGTDSILSLLIRETRELKHELLASSFFHDRIIDLISYGRPFFLEIIKALDRGVQIKYLWSPELEYNNNTLKMDLTKRNYTIYKKIKRKIRELYNLSSDVEGFEMKYIPNIIPTHFNIFDKERIIIKMQNPSRMSEIFTTMNVLDPLFAMELREIFLKMWHFEAMD